MASGEQEVHQEKEDSMAQSVLARFKNMKKKESNQRYNRKVSSSSTEHSNDRPKCMDNSSKKCDIDEIGRYLESSSLFTMIHLPNDAIPKNRRIPKHKAGDDAYIRDRRDKGPRTGSRTALVDYNPSILPLSFDDWDQNLLDDITGRYHPDFSKEEADRVKYIQVSRSGNLHGCGFNNTKKLNHPTREISMLSLVLLDKDLNPIPKASVAFPPAWAQSPRCFFVDQMSVYQDYSLVVARSTKYNTKKDQLFLYTSEGASYIFPIDIRRVPAPTNNVSDWNTKMVSEAVPMIAREKFEKSLFYGTGLQVRFMDELRPPDAEYLFYCQGMWAHRAADRNKNYHVFEGMDENGILDTYMELRPHWNRRVRKVNFFGGFAKFKDRSLVENDEWRGNDPNATGHPIGMWAKFRMHMRNQSDVIKSKSIIREQFHGKNDISWLKQKRGRDGRGTACCMDVEVQVVSDSNARKTETYKVGISHSSSNYEYVSRFYAFNAKHPPFELIALSGPFCLGFVNRERDRNADSQIYVLADKKRLGKYDCPKISFLSGIIEYQKDPRYAVISYGVN
ncbi:hypothetical protein CTEN210_18234 [Chaetoceros tenuissimus]|uniref:Uncharacterized protein n=1 Tax=Chaetoceros tenuissimus TaxID=426638 RepID=A0AAD3HG38_9STRA|nr:hypothetical protein CTEN210_18234 [Chaetoceros tenuissimus]